MATILPKVLSSLSFLVIVGVACFILRRLVRLSFDDNAFDDSFGEFSDDNLSDKIPGELDNFLGVELGIEYIFFFLLLLFLLLFLFFPLLLLLSFNFFRVLVHIIILM